MYLGSITIDAQLFSTSARGLQPHRLKSFKLTRDPEFAKKLRDVVGLYLDPPDKVLVLWVDEESHIQALDHLSGVHLAQDPSS